MKKNFEIDHEGQQIVITKSFAVIANDVRSMEYKATYNLFEGNRHG